MSEPLPICDDTDDDEDFDHVDMVPETQPINEEAVQVEEVKEVAAEILTNFQYFMIP